jgi:hypothetical protein
VGEATPGGADRLREIDTRVAQLVGSAHRVRSKLQRFREDADTHLEGDETPRAAAMDGAGGERTERTLERPSGKENNGDDLADGKRQQRLRLLANVNQCLQAYQAPNGAAAVDTRET